MSKPKPKHKFAACRSCRGKGLVYWHNGSRVAATTIPPPLGSVFRYCTCELGEAKREAATKGDRR